MATAANHHKNETPRKATHTAHAESGSNGRTGFANLSAKASAAVGSQSAFLLAILVVVVWGVTGPVYHFSDTWQLVINTGTTIITFLMVFLIQNTQNRDAKAIHLKLNELIYSVERAHNELIDVEELSDHELQHLHDHYVRIREEFERRDARRRKEPAQHSTIDSESDSGSEARTNTKTRKTA
jgi:low affinity Fe/Cu permease